MADAVPFFVRRIIGRVRRLQRVADSLPARISYKRDVARAMAQLAVFPAVEQPRKHGLPGELIISLTSFPKRFPVVALTIKSLLDQTVRADRVVMWIDQSEVPHLGADVLALQGRGLEIRLAEETRSYKKIVPTLAAWPDAFIVTADDDLYYHPGWLESLITQYDPVYPRILCHRAHRVARQTDGEMLPYQFWPRQIIDHRPSKESIFPTGTGGVLYYPGSLSPEVLNAAVFKEICPKADDVWLYWMGRLAGSEYQQIGGYFRSIEWPSSQVVSLYSQNTTANDAQIRAMRLRYGRV